MTQIPQFSGQVDMSRAKMSSDKKKRFDDSLKRAQTQVQNDSCTLTMKSKDYCMTGAKQYFEVTAPGSEVVVTLPRLQRYYDVAHSKMKGTEQFWRDAVNVGKALSESVKNDATNAYLDSELIKDGNSAELYFWAKHAFRAADLQDQLKALKEKGAVIKLSASRKLSIQLPDQVAQITSFSDKSNGDAVISTIKVAINRAHKQAVNPTETNSPPSTPDGVVQHDLKTKKELKGLEEEINQFRYLDSGLTKFLEKMRQENKTIARTFVKGANKLNWLLDEVAEQHKALVAINSNSDEFKTLKQELRDALKELDGVEKSLAELAKAKGYAVPELYEDDDEDDDEDAFDLRDLFSGFRTRKNVKEPNREMGDDETSELLKPIFADLEKKRHVDLPALSKALKLEEGDKTAFDESIKKIKDAISTELSDAEQKKSWLDKVDTLATQYADLETGYKNLVEGYPKPEVLLSCNNADALKSLQEQVDGMTQLLKTTAATIAKETKELTRYFVDGDPSVFEFNEDIKALLRQQYDAEVAQSGGENNDTGFKAYLLKKTTAFNESQLKAAQAKRAEEADEALKRAQAEAYHSYQDKPKSAAYQIADWSLWLASLPFIWGTNILSAAWSRLPAKKDTTPLLPR